MLLVPTRDRRKSQVSNLRHHFSVVGLSERLEESLALMKLRFGWKLKLLFKFQCHSLPAKKARLARTTLDLIQQRNAFDIDLYQRAAGDI